MQVLSRYKPKKNRKGARFIYVRALKGYHGILQIGHKRFPCILGQNAITAFKRENDGKTPRATMAIIGAFYRPDRTKKPRIKLPVYAIKADDGWCDESGDRNYNRPVKLPYRASHETLTRQDRLYDIALILDWNFKAPIPKKGSAIFMHLNPKSGRPTRGCIALTPKHMAQILPYLNKPCLVRVL